MAVFGQRFQMNVQQPVARLALHRLVRVGLFGQGFTE